MVVQLHLDDVEDLRQVRLSDVVDRQLPSIAEAVTSQLSINLTNVRMFVIGSRKQDVAKRC